MGWVAYRVTRSSGGTKDIILPKVDFPIEMESGRFTLSDLTSIPDFPIESVVFINSALLSVVEDFGFPNIINVSEFIGERWAFENGNYISFDINGQGDETISFNYSDNTVYYSTGFSQEYCYPTFAPGLVGEDKEAVFHQGNIAVSGINQGKFYLYNIEYFPELESVRELTFFEGLTPIVETGDPYEEGGSSGVGGGTGTFSGTGDAIAIPSLPTLSAVDAGFITLFNPTISQLGSLASYMWSGLFDIDGWRKIFADPMNAILGLSIVPVNVPSGGAKTVKVGNISTGVSMTVASSQYVEVDCGTLNVREFWGAYLDYDPYTKAEIYLPYIGTHALAVDDIMNKSVHVVYHVDVLSGACCAYVQCGGTVLYTFIGQCSSSIPITGDNWTNVINGAISIAGSIGSMVATGGVSAPMEIGNIASTAVNTMKPSVEKSGAMGGTGGMMGVQTPYLILTRPRQALPARQNTFTGYPSFITEQLSTLSGYTEVFKIHLENVPATEQELSEIETLLKSGVIF